ncbi:hypothetical protein NMY22_g4633 [Coprinellus aureogranulatus]|nr:hypothetical protein NMY22_g4633 [Coprinellus aureogranulatus]
MSSLGAEFPLEVSERVLLYLADDHPKHRKDVVLVSKRMRVVARRGANAEIHGAGYYPEPMGNSQTIVLPEHHKQFLNDITKFNEVFPPSTKLSFCEVENLKIVLPFQNEATRKLVERILAAFRRSLEQGKIAAHVEDVKLDKYSLSVGRLGRESLMGRVKTLTLAIFHERGQLPSFALWHQPQFLDQLKPFQNLVALKVRAAVEMTPVISSPEMASNMEKNWVGRVRDRIPALEVLYLDHSFSENLEEIGNIPYRRGMRTVHYKDNTGEWKESCWIPADMADEEGNRRLPMLRRKHPGKTTQKGHFDAWQSDEEYEEFIEKGWDL